MLSAPKRTMNKILPLLTVCVTSLALALSLTGCGQISAKDTVDQELSSIKSLTAEDVTNYIADNTGNSSASRVVEGLGLNALADLSNLSDTGAASLGTVYEKLFDFDYEIGDVTEKDGTATVDVTFKAYDHGAAIASAWSSYIKELTSDTSWYSREDAEAYAMERLCTHWEEAESALEEKTVATKTTITLTKDDDGNWTVDAFSDETYEALTGGLVSALSDLQAS